MHVIGCQLDIVWEDKPANFGRVRTLLEQHRPAAGALVILPEMFATGFSFNVARTAESATGETSAFLRSLAQEFSVHVLAGLVTANKENVALLFDPTGHELARYSKRHLFTPGGESDYHVPGRETIVVHCGDFELSPFICYDLRFPAAFQTATRLGAQLLVVIANWPQVRDDHWTNLLRARAIENQAYVVGVNRTGRDPHHAYAGHSLVVDPRGTVLVEAGAGECVLDVELDLPTLTGYRREFPVLADTGRGGR